MNSKVGPTVALTWYIAQTLDNIYYALSATAGCRTSKFTASQYICKNVYNYKVTVFVNKRSESAFVRAEHNMSTFQCTTTHVTTKLQRQCHVLLPTE